MVSDMSSAFPLNASVELNNGVLLPLLGLGVYQIPKGLPTEQAVLWALEAGYRHIDTASFYGNEESVGKAIRESGIKREEMFITTKLWPTDFFNAEKAFHKSRERLGLEFIDLYLVHWPSPIARDGAWKALEKLYTEKHIRAIGVSNYSVAQLQTHLKKHEIVPAVNQVEFSPFNYKKELLEFCQAHKIQLEAYSPLTRGKKLDHPALEDLAKRLGKSVAQVMLRWAIQRNVVVLPKSQRKERISENSQIFDFVLSPEEMAILDSLNENYRALFK